MKHSKSIYTNNVRRFLTDSHPERFESSKAVEDKAKQVSQSHCSQQSESAFENVQIKQEVSDNNQRPPLSDSIYQEEFENIFVKQELILDDSVDVTSYSHDFLLEIGGNDQEVHNDVIENPPSVDHDHLEQSENIQLDFQTSREKNLAALRQIRKNKSQEHSIAETDQEREKSSEKSNIQEKKTLHLDPSMNIRLASQSQKSSKLLENRSIEKSGQNTSLKENSVESTVKNMPSLSNLKPCVSIIKLASPPKEKTIDSSKPGKSGHCGNTSKVSGNKSLIKKVSFVTIQNPKSSDHIIPVQTESMALQTCPELVSPQGHDNAAGHKEVERRNETPDTPKNTFSKKKVDNNVVQKPPSSSLCKPCVCVIKLTSSSKGSNNNSSKPVKSGSLTKWHNNDVSKLVKSGSLLIGNNNDTSKQIKSGLSGVIGTNTSSKETSTVTIQNPQSSDHINPVKVDSRSLQTSPVLDPHQGHDNAKFKEVEKRNIEIPNICMSAISKEKVDNVQNPPSSSLGNLKPCVNIIRLDCSLQNPSKECKNASPNQMKTRSCENINLKKNVSGIGSKNLSYSVLTKPEASKSTKSSQNTTEECRGTQTAGKSLEKSKESFVLESMRKEMSEFTLQFMPSPGHNIQPQFSCSSTTMTSPVQSSSVKQNNVSANQMTRKSVERSLRRKNYCPFCKSSKIANFPRHLFSKHSDEKEVKEYLKYDKYSYERVQLLRILKSRGDNLHYLEAMRSKQGELARMQRVLGHRSCAQETEEKSLKKRYKYLCPFCGRSIKDLPRHVESIHPEEKEVKELMNHDKRSQERVELLKRLRNRGNQLFNSKRKQHSMNSVKRSAGMKSVASKNVGKTSIDQLPQIFYCPFCRVGVGKLPRHLERKHAEEEEVKQLMKLDKKTHERMELLTRLRERGDALHKLEASKKVKIIM